MFINSCKHNFQCTSVCCYLGSFIIGITCSAFSSQHHIDIIYFSIFHQHHYFLLQYLDLEVFMALIIMVTVFLDVMPYSLVGTCSSIIRVTEPMLMTETAIDSSTTITEAVGSLHLYTTTSYEIVMQSRCYINIFKLFHIF
jgi:hypothetical protein